MPKPQDVVVPTSSNSTSFENWCLMSSSMNGSNPAASANSLASPLQVFVRAKKKINDVFQEIEEYVTDSAEFIQGVSSDMKIVSSEDCGAVGSYHAKVVAIKEVLARDHMKVVFFGRTSNGKSTVINAMLGDKILPAGMGHTTNCFLQVEGEDSTEAFLKEEGSDERKGLDSIGGLAHALCNNRMGDSSLVRIHWPKSRCPLLRDDVVLLDSPGMDVSNSLDGWIDKYCLDADVFVWVANSESTLMMTEKNFFLKVAERLSKPNVFILQNRWDVVALNADDDIEENNTAMGQTISMDQVRQQHLDAATAFLSGDLGVVDLATAKQRVFFVSAKEVLRQRLAEARATAGSAPPAKVNGHSSRYFEFKDFEKKFEECISKTAVVTKFEQHAQQGKGISANLQDVHSRVYTAAVVLRDAKEAEMQVLKRTLHQNEAQLEALTLHMKERIGGVVDVIEKKVSDALSQEIRRLSTLVEDFDEPFHAAGTPLLNMYKRTLNTHVESTIGLNLHRQLSDVMKTNIESSQQEMARSMLALISPDKQQIAAQLVPKSGNVFQINFGLNCDKLCQNFQENITFKFSLGVVNMINTFTRPRSGPNSSPSNAPPITLTPEVNAGLSMVSSVALRSVQGQGTMGVALLAGMLIKTVGWRAVGALAALYGGVYAYERLTWTTKAQERVFKAQYVAHASHKLRAILELTSRNCSHQVQQELTGTFARLCRLVDESVSDTRCELRGVQRQTDQLRDVISRAEELRNTAGYLHTQLTNFSQTYLPQAH